MNLKKLKWIKLKINYQWLDWLVETNDIELIKWYIRITYNYLKKVKIYKEKKNMINII